MDTTDRFILDIIQTGFPLVSRPYESIGQQVGLTEAETLARVASFTRDMGLREDGATAYVCSGQRCDAPETDPEELARKLWGPLAKSGSNS